MDLKNASIITAIVTPFDHKGEIDFNQLEKLIEYLLANGSEGLVVGGTTGESPTLSHDEKLALYKKTIEIVDGRVPLIAGTGSNNTKETIAFTKETAALGGIDAALVVAPYYNKPNQLGLYAHFEAVAGQTDLPIILYNVPGRTNVSINPETTIRLSAIENIIGIKECQGLDAMSQIIEGTTDDFLVYTGEDNLTYPAKCIGATGVISVASHILGQEMAEMYRLLAKGNVSEAANIHRKIVPKMNSLFTVPSPAPVKFALSRLGIETGSPRLPLMACTEEEKQKLMEILQLN